MSSLTERLYEKAKKGVIVLGWFGPGRRIGFCFLIVINNSGHADGDRLYRLYASSEDYWEGISFELEFVERDSVNGRRAAIPGYIRDEALPNAFRRAGGRSDTGDDVGVSVKGLYARRIASANPQLTEVLDVLRASLYNKISPMKGGWRRAIYLDFKRRIQGLIKKQWEVQATAGADTFLR